MKVKLKRFNELAKTPVKAHEKDFCYDVYASSVEEIAPSVYKYGIGWGFQIERSVPFQSCEGEIEKIVLSIDIRPRSSVYKTGLILSNCIGTIDEEYTGEVSMVFYKVSEGEIYKVGDRIGQIKIGITTTIEFVEVESLNETDRGDGGYGSTGK